jgi:epoxyqueuosine reductase QueG
MNNKDVSELIQRFVLTSPLNTIKELGDLQIYEAPLVAVAAADDELFEQLKAADAAGPQHKLPTEWLPEAKAVIVYFLPFSERVRQANRKQGVAATEWLYGRIEGEQFSVGLRQYLLAALQAAGCQAVAPSLDPRFAVTQRRSNWSERHVAFVAGLGTFSLSRSMITKKGSAGRFGSVIVDLPLEPTSRPYHEIDEYCIKCGACILRCPPLAITEAGKDNAVCSGYLDRVLARFHPRYGCGKCQTGVPCEHQIPGGQRKSN